MFEYITQVNKRSKRIKLQFCSYRGLIISSPKKLSQKRLDGICLEHQDWIQIQQDKHPIEPLVQPSHLNLIALEKTYELGFIINHKNKVTAKDNHLVIQGQQIKQQIINLKNGSENKPSNSLPISLKIGQLKPNLTIQN